MLEIKNYMEKLVFQEIDKIMEEVNMCTCEKCKYDVAAIALNLLPPKYVVSDKGQVFTKLSSVEEQFKVDVLSAITKAAMKVKQSPNHE